MLGSGHVAGIARPISRNPTANPQDLKRGNKALLDVDVFEAISVPRSVNPGTASSVGRDSWARAAWRRMESPVCRRRSSDIRLLRHRSAVRYFLSRPSFVSGPTFWRDGRWQRGKWGRHSSTTDRRCLPHPISDWWQLHPRALTLTKD